MPLQDKMSMSLEEIIKQRSSGPGKGLNSSNRRGRGRGRGGRGRGGVAYQRSQGLRGRGQGRGVLRGRGQGRGRGSSLSLAFRAWGSSEEVQGRPQTNSSRGRGRFRSLSRGRGRGTGAWVRGRSRSRSRPPGVGSQEPTQNRSRPRGRSRSRGGGRGGLGGLARSRSRSRLPTAARGRSRSISRPRGRSRSRPPLGLGARSRSRSRSTIRGNISDPSPLALARARSRSRSRSRSRVRQSPRVVLFRPGGIQRPQLRFMRSRVRQAARFLNLRGRLRPSSADEWKMPGTFRSDYISRGQRMFVQSQPSLADDSSDSFNVPDGPYDNQLLVNIRNEYALKAPGRSRGILRGRGGIRRNQFASTSSQRSLEMLTSSDAPDLPQNSPSPALETFALRGGNVGDNLHNGLSITQGLKGASDAQNPSPLPNLMVEKTVAVGVAQTMACATRMTLSERFSK